MRKILHHGSAMNSVAMPETADNQRAPAEYRLANLWTNHCQCRWLKLQRLRAQINASSKAHGLDAGKTVTQDYGETVGADHGVGMDRLAHRCSPECRGRISSPPGVAGRGPPDMLAPILLAMWTLKFATLSSLSMEICC